MAEKIKDETSSIQIVCFKIGNEEYGIDILRVQEILKLPNVTKLPGSLSYILGVIDLRGKVIPIVDLSERFGISSLNENLDKRSIVVEILGKQVGLAIDSVSHVVRVNSVDIDPPPPVVKGIAGKYIVGIAKLKESFVVILDINQIFSQEELLKI